MYVAQLPKSIALWLDIYLVNMHAIIKILPYIKVIHCQDVRSHVAKSQSLHHTSGLILIMKSKYYLLFFWAISISFICVSAQTCPQRLFSEVYNYYSSWVNLVCYVLLGNITDRVDAELIRSDSGLLLGIRVSWSWLSSDPVECFHSPTVELRPITGTAIQRTLDSISRNNSVEFNTTELDCNQMYFLTLRATLSHIGQFQRGNDIFFGGIIIYTHN